MQWLTVNGQVNDSLQKPSGNMPVEADSKTQSMLGATKTYAQENPKPIRGKALFLIETIRVMAFTLQHLYKAIKQTAMACMIWQATYGNGALTCTTRTTIKP